MGTIFQEKGIQVNPLTFSHPTCHPHSLPKVVKTRSFASLAFWSWRFAPSRKRLLSNIWNICVIKDYLTRAVIYLCLEWSEQVKWGSSAGQFGKRCLKKQKDSSSGNRMSLRIAKPMLVKTPTSILIVVGFRTLTKASKIYPVVPKSSLIRTTSKSGQELFDAKSIMFPIVPRKAP